VAVDALLQEWRGLQDDLTRIAPNAQREVVQAKLDAIHARELQIVLRTFGDQVVTRVLNDASQGLGAAQAQLEAAGQAADMTSVLSVVRQVREKMAAARAAVAANDMTRALDEGAEAVTLVSGLNFYLVELQRINGLEVLFPRAVETLAQQPHDARTQGLLAAADRASAAAGNAMRLGDREAAQTQLRQARAEQIDVVLAVLGTSAASQLVRQTGTRITLLRGMMDSLDARGRDVTRYKRMLGEANDLSTRAALALEKGNAATALDLGSHAAGMLNALQHLTWK